MTAKHPLDSKVEMTQIVLPAHTNRFGTVFGGTVMSWIDICAAVSAMRHAANLAVTASMDELHFLSGAKLGQIMTLKSQVNYAGTSSMEIGVRVESEDPVSGVQKHTATAYLTFVAVDEHGKRQAVPELIPTTDTERRRYEKAAERRKRRLDQKQEALQRSARSDQI
jgi:acyl-CoA hydrolase